MKNSNTLWLVVLGTLLVLNSIVVSWEKGAVEIVGEAFTRLLIQSMAILGLCCSHARFEDSESNPNYSAERGFAKGILALFIGFISILVFYSTLLVGSRTSAFVATQLVCIGSLIVFVSIDVVKLSKRSIAS